MNKGKKLFVEKAGVNDVKGGYQAGLKFRDLDPEWRNNFYKNKEDIPDFVQDGAELIYGEDVVFNKKKKNKRDGYWHNWKEPSETDRLRQKVDKLEARQNKIIKYIKNEFK